MEKLGEPKANRLVFVVFPFQGHINPMLQLATILHSKGFSITIVHPQFNYPNSSNHRQFTFKPIIDNSPESKLLPGDFFGIINALNKNCQVPFELCMKKMLEKEDSDDRISCIVYDGLMHFAQTVANNLKLRGISVRTTAAAAIFTNTVFPHPHQQGNISLLGGLQQVGDIEGPDLKTSASFLVITRPVRAEDILRAAARGWGTHPSKIALLRSFHICQ
ncbi:UDP-glycosyltransferase 76C3-like [Hevea brasiliensis]|uniref:UDP-glycosyltransferase 76C3-like n=1 Tax=Hevea brasiliensis TaxID=3981 RepID=UPI0025E74D1D|nr:UDP-glycosyltransferase 76C3-like [Hevea brasiliensis]